MFGAGFNLMIGPKHALEAEFSKLIECRVSEHEDFPLVVVTRAADVAVEDRRAVRGGFARRVSVHVVVENGFDRAVGLRADVDGAGGGGFEPLAAERLDQANDAEAGAEALFRMGSALQDQLA